MPKKSVNEIKQIIRDAIPRLNEEDRGNKKPISADKLDAINIEDIQNELENRWSYEVWDKVSPINGVEANRVLERHSYITDDMEVYLIREGDRVIYFQPHVPGVEGIQKMKKNDVKTHAENHKDSVIDEQVIQRVIQLLDE